ncbi:hypothetical protein AB4Y30_07845 [Ornithinibacillus sp. 4-3]|uniref:Uncharacterized protein n=1 Tax=Ornithinibacillus sp. 4-3 TaxID=3231488 RepID=A0AB39HV68_9BACI
MIGIKISSYVYLAETVSIIRKFDNSISIKEIKDNISNQKYVLEYDIYQFDITEEIQHIDRKDTIMELVSNLLNNNISISIFIEDEEVNFDFFKNYLESAKEIEKQTMLDMEREAEK